MIKVLHVTNAYPCEGTPEYGVFVKEQIESLPTESVKCDVVFINGRDGGKWAYLRSMQRIRSIFLDYDVVHCHHVYSMLTVMLAGVIGKRPVVLSFLNDWLYEVKAFRFSALQSLVCKLVVKGASIIIFKSPVPDELSSSDKVFNLPNGVDSEFFNLSDRSSSQSALGLDRSKKYLLFVSSKNQYRKQKRYDIFKKVLDRVRQLRPDLAVEEIVMVGQARQVVPLIFSSAAVHVLTSDYEGSPNSVKESMCCGTPVVARDVGNVRDMLAGLPGAVVTRSADVDEISEAVIRLLDDEIDPSVVREGFLSKGLTKQRIANRLVSLYEAAISSRRK